MPKIIHSKEFPGRLLGSLLKTGLPLMKNVLKTLAKSILIPLRLTAAALAANAGIHQKILASAIITLIISNEKMAFIIKIVKSLDKSGLLIEVVTETIENKAKDQKSGFLSMLLGY